MKDEPEETEHLFFTTRQGTVKRTAFSEFANIRTSGLKAISLKDEDELISVSLTNGDQNIIIGTRQGYAVSFHESEVRSMGRSAAGVRGVRLREDDAVVGMDILHPDSDVLIITEKGYGKRTPAAEYAVKGRGGKGVKTANITEKNGPLIGLKTVDGHEDIMLITNGGVIIRFHAKNISQTGRSTQGVRLMRLEEGKEVSTLAKVEPEEENDETVTEENANVEESAENSPLVDELIERAEEDSETEE
jgi:DNA gyrase subunit A